MADGLYPWFRVAEGDDLEQGDIFEAFPVPLPGDKLVFDPTEPTTATFSWKRHTLVVLSQSCDLVKGREKIDHILFCAVWAQSELKSHDLLGKADGMERARKGSLPAFHVLMSSTVEGFTREVRVVDFRRVFSLPIGFVRDQARDTRRLRLQPPYREHLSQSFARFFMRVGLPTDIPPFK